MEAVRAHPARRRIQARSDPSARDPAARPATLERITSAVDRRLAWDACLNVRDLGGLTCGDAVLGRGRLVRASMIGALSPAGREAMRRYGIRTVIDLRTEDEIAEAASPYREGVTYRNEPFTVARTMGLHRAAAEGTMPDELRRLAVRDGGIAGPVRAIAAAEPGVLLHCAAGRDRTGIVVAAVLAALDVPDPEIVADYVASDAELEPEYVRFRSANPGQAADVDAGIERRARTMGEVLTTWRLSFGGAAAYLNAAGVTDDELDAIRTKLTA
ncbi:MAG TPA: tyrosine-protein phosphatase [Candidatus Limnocylindria bacterium]